MKTQGSKNERIDIRVTPEEKEIFLRAHRLSGERTFSAFITHAVRTRSYEIIEENERILASERDKRIFFNAILADQEPNQSLKEAAKKYKSLQNKKS